MSRVPSVGVAALAVLLSIPAAAAPSGGTRRVEVSEDLALLIAEGQLFLEARPLEGEASPEFAKRIADSEATARALLSFPPSLDRSVILPYELASSEAKRAAMKALFPSDVRATSAWLHIAVGEENLDSLSSWFTGDPRLGAVLAARNGLKGKTVPRGTTIRIAAELLLPAFRDVPPIGEEEPVKLEFGADGKGRYAVYRLRPHEALYSAVVVRFTGRLHAADVVELALRIAERSGIEDVHAIPVGYPVKIPLDVLSAEFLPKEDPRARELVSEKAEASQFSKPARARGLAGVRIILDAGHGGRDTGTLHAGVWEATYVYDVACRLRKVLTETTGAEVVMTTKDGRAGWNPPDSDRLPSRKSAVLLTNPPYALDDPVVGVNLRWYLANALLARPGPDRRPVPPERTVFLSIHADSLHPSVRGAMAYIPGERFLRDRYGKSAPLYREFAEWRTQPVVSFNRKERYLAEGVSTTLAEKILGAMRRAELPIHRFSPVRTHVIRAGREWVPAVLRYNRIPNRVLLEIANLGNEEDRALVTTRAFRQSAADAIARGLVEFFGEDEPEAPRPTATPTSAPPAPVQVEVAGPWREVAGPWKGGDRVAERPAATATPAPKKTPKPTPRPTPKKQRPKRRR